MNNVIPFITTTNSSINNDIIINTTISDKETLSPSPTAFSPISLTYFTSNYQTNIIAIYLKLFYSFFDFSRIKIQLLGIILAFVIQIIIFGSILLTVRNDDTFKNTIWDTWLLMTDPGSQAELNPEIDSERILYAIISSAGIFFMALLIAIVIEVVQHKLRTLKSNRKLAYMSGHTIMIGWTTLSLDIILQLCEAWRPLGGSKIIVLIDQPIEDIEQLFYHNLKRMKQSLYKTRIIFWQGSVLNPLNLITIHVTTADRIIVLSPTDLTPDKADGYILNATLVLNSIQLKSSTYVIVEIRDIDNQTIIELVSQINIETFVSHDIVGRLMLMSARKAGMSELWTTILGFEGNEFYIKEWPELNGCLFSELVSKFENAIPIGVYIYSSNDCILNPCHNYHIQKGDRIIVFAETELSYSIKQNDINEQRIQPPSPEQKIILSVNEHILIAGWRRDIRDLIILLDSSVSKESTLTIMCELSTQNQMSYLKQYNLDSLKNLNIKHITGNTRSRRDLEKLPLHIYTSIMILSDQTYENDTMYSDSHTLATLVLLRQIQLQKCEKSDLQRRVCSISDTNYIQEYSTSRLMYMACPMICEILDRNTQNMLAINNRITMLSDFVQSKLWISQCLSMITINREINLILKGFLKKNGNIEFVLNSPHYYSINDNFKISFYDLQKHIQTYHEILIGYQTLHGRPNSMHTVLKRNESSSNNIRHSEIMNHDLMTIINPPDKHTKLSWSHATFIIIRSIK